MEDSKDERSSTIEEPEQERKTEVKLNIDDSKMFEKKLSIFGSHDKKENKSNIFANTKSVNLFSLNPTNQQENGLNIFKMAASSQPTVSNDPEDDLNSLSSRGPEDNTIEQALPEPA
jgi:hypothetical protein